MNYFIYISHKGNNVTQEPFTGSAVHGRLKFYLDQIQANDRENPHSSRSGCSITLSLYSEPLRKQLLTTSVGLVRRWLTTTMTSEAFYALMLQLRYFLRKLLALRATLLWPTSPFGMFLLLSLFFHSFFLSV